MKKNKYNKLVKDLVDSDYTNRPVKDSDGKVVESLKLSDKDKEFLNDFNDGYYANNHRKQKIFTEHPEYNTRIKKELDDQNNSRMRDLLTMNRYSKKMINDLTKIANPEYSNNELEDDLLDNGFEETITDLIDNTLNSLDGFSIKNQFDLKEGQTTLANFCIDIVRVVKMKQSLDRNKED